MELIELSSFYHIVRTGSFSKASETIFRTPSAVSHHIRNLESELRVKLFERVGSTVILTKEGELLLDIVSRFFTDLEDLKKIYADVKQEGGSITVATTDTVAKYALHDAIKSFIKEFPKTKLRVVICNRSVEIQRLVLSCDVDFGIAVSPKDSLPSNLTFLPWRTFEMILIASKHHPLSHKGSIQLTDIASYPLILYGKGTRAREIVDAAFLKSEVSYNVIIEIDLSEDIKTYVDMGCGVSILSSLTILPEDEKRFFAVNVTGLFHPLEFGIYYRKGKYISAPIKHFFERFYPSFLSQIH